MEALPEGIKKAAVLCVLKHQAKGRLPELLLLKRLKEPNQHLYTPVGGKLDPYESPLSAAIRETKEEAGVEVPTMKYCGTLVESSPTKYNWINFVYVADIERVSPSICNEGELRWISLEEVTNIPTPKTDWFIYQFIFQNRKFAFHADFDDQINLVRMTDMLTEEVVYRSAVND
ncbi:NUDIX domain-containing protein [Tunicatimonas pelagia]|uniref:NUDIX domain-containing protein n=1 Tax=Tunicatimonas pelagia TaxID=931531 RepID=UPI002666FAB9|nr:NUDIX domain-containing protein [Tunicatimonas pelagia]WKN45282.1 NUDIX domain-containing protein [Tunicatimonas pelagia]